MQHWQEIKPEAFIANPFVLIGQEWMLVTARKGSQVNTMTASWGGLGVMWGENVAFVVIRQSRHTKGFVDAADHFSLTFFPEGYRKTLNYLGTVSGRDENKIKKSGLTIVDYDSVPCFAEANRAILCRKLFAQPYDPAAFLDPLVSACYPKQDYHTLYIGAIEKILLKADEPAY